MHLPLTCLHIKTNACNTSVFIVIYVIVLWHYRSGEEVLRTLPSARGARDVVPVWRLVPLSPALTVGS